MTLQVSFRENKKTAPAASNDGELHLKQTGAQNRERVRLAHARTHTSFLRAQVRWLKKQELFFTT